MEEIISLIPGEPATSATKFFIWQTGRFVIGGPMGDCGLTGRKIIVHSAAWHVTVVVHSLKDPSKVDRSAAYCSIIAIKNIVAAGLADRCEIQFPCAIGVAERPLSW